MCMHIWIQLLHLSHKQRTTQYIVEIYPSESVLYLIQSRYLLNHNFHPCTDKYPVFKSPSNTSSPCLSYIYYSNRVYHWFTITMTRVLIKITIMSKLNLKYINWFKERIQLKVKVSNFRNTTITCFFHYFHNFSCPGFIFNQCWKTWTTWKSRNNLLSVLPFF